MAWRAFGVLVVVVASLGVSSPARAQRLRIEVSGANFRPYPVAAPDPVLLRGEGEAARKLVKEIEATLQVGVDLTRSLELVPPRSYLDPEKESWVKPNFPNWVNVGASGLVRAAVEVDEGKVRVSFRFYDVMVQREQLVRTYDVTPDTASQAVHRFLDDLVEHLTGERGIFSSRLAFVRKTRNGKVVVVSDIDGRNAEAVTGADDLSLLPEWDRTGSNLLFTSYMKGNPDLFRMRLADRELEWLSNKRGLNTGASVSPDGKRIALTLSTDGNTEIYVMDANGGNLKQLTNSWGQDVSPTWSPDGRRLAFVSSRAGQPHLYVMNADGSNPTRLTFQGTYNQEPDWSPREDGQIAFTARDEHLKYDVFLVHPQTGIITRLTQDDANNQSPSHSPDGQLIAFVSNRPPKPGYKLYVMDVDGTNQRRLPAAGTDIETPAWSVRRKD